MKKVSNMEIEDVKVILRIDGEEVEAERATEEEIKAIEAAGYDAACDCGLQICVGGNVYVCRFARPSCYWYRTRVRCNEN